MSYISKTKFGDCSMCPATNVDCVKIGKRLICTKCNNNEKAQAQIAKFKDKQKQRNALTQDVRKIRSFAKTDDNNRQAAKVYQTKSQLLQEADRLFSEFIRGRDCDKNGNVACVCCGKIYNREDKDRNGDKVVQCLHFIKREVYSLRFDEDNTATGCSYCNKDMHLNPTGTAYKQFKEYLIADLGENAVAEMEVAHRKVNMLEAQQLKNIIEHYELQMR